jgi:hypothetical protein
MTKHNSKDMPKKNSKAMAKHNSNSKKESNLKSYSDHLTKKTENQKNEKGTPSQRKKITKRKRVKMRRVTQNHKNNNRKRRTPRQNRTINQEVNNINITNDFAERGNINFQRSLNISHAISSEDHGSLQLSNLNEENNSLRNYSYFEEIFNFNFDIINEMPINQNNDEVLSDFSFIRNISTNHLNRIEIGMNLFDMLPKIKIGDISNLLDEQCTICLNNFLKDEIITTLSCSHVFHSPCLKQWMLQKTTCPLCRSNIGGKRN